MRPQAQTSLYETTLEDPDLEAALEKREKAKASAANARKRYTEADGAAKALADAHDIADAPVRVGRFVISRRQVAPRSVAFETAGSERIAIGLLPED